MISVVYDVETFPNCFLLSACTLGKPEDMTTWEISPRRNDAASLMAWLLYLRDNGVEMIGFNSLFFDYPVIHYFLTHGVGTTAHELYSFAMSIMRSESRFDHIVFENQRIVKQVDLFKIHHFDNLAKQTSLKKLQFNMRSKTVEDLPFEPNKELTADEIVTLIQYNCHDVSETDRFAHHSREAIAFRRELTAEMTGDVMNFNDTKIGKQYFIQELGESLCYTRGPSGGKIPRQTIRSEIRLGEVVFPYIAFHRPEFNTVLADLKSRVITETKGVFKDLAATIEGFTFVFGTGGIHGSVERQRVLADDDFAIIDVDVTSLYPSIAIVNRLYPAHLGEGFVTKYAELKQRRVSYKKGTAQNAMLKLGLNGVYGDSNSQFSVFYDPQYTMSITINGQLLLCMLAEWLLLGVPGLQLIQINTDGVTARVPRAVIPTFEKVCKDWERFTCLELEHARYQRMFIRDVNNYVAEYEKTGKIKAKGAYNFPRTIKDYDGEWDANYSELVVKKAAQAAMLYGVPPDEFIWSHFDPFDFMICAKATGKSRLYIGNQQMSKTTRYYIALDGGEMYNIAPPVAGATYGGYKRKPKISDAEFYRINSETPPGTWNPLIHTGNKSTYEDRKTGISVGWLTAECNNAERFDWARLNREYYIQEALKLIIN